MKRIIAGILAAVLFLMFASACRTIEDTKPANETTNPNIVYLS